jgi:L-aspartate oxidase
MWNYAGIIRTTKRLERARADLEYLQHRIDKFIKRRPWIPSWSISGMVTGSLTDYQSRLANPKAKGSYRLN